MTVELYLFGRLVAQQARGERNAATRPESASASKEISAETSREIRRVKQFKSVSSSSETSGWDKWETSHDKGPSQQALGPSSCFGLQVCAMSRTTRLS